MDVTAGIITLYKTTPIVPPSYLLFLSIATVTYHRIASRSDLQEAHSARYLTRGYLFWLVGPSMSLYVRRFWTQCSLSDVATLCFSPPQRLPCNANVYGDTPARARNGIPWSHLDGMSRAVSLKEEWTCFILHLCVHPREFSSSIAYSRTPLPSLADYSRLPRIASARFYALEICEIGCFSSNCGYPSYCTK